jgi:hypothetical protein
MEAQEMGKEVVMEVGVLSGSVGREEYESKEREYHVDDISHLRQNLA